LAVKSPKKINREWVAVDQIGRAGQQKGLQQCLWERGSWFEHKENHLYKNARRQKAGKGFPMMPKLVPPSKTDDHFRDHPLCMQHVLGQCRDFANETSALEEKFRVLGRGLTMSPKGHPELAGEGIEFSWGVS
jgi:hypothetical protein